MGDVILSAEEVKSVVWEFRTAGGYREMKDAMARLVAHDGALRARLAEVEQALREAKEALDKTVPVLLTVKPNLDRPYPDALTLTPWTRWCEPLARRVDDARRSARAVLDKGEQPDG